MKKTFLMLSLIAMALIGCGPINGPINPNENNDTIPTDSVVVPFEIWLDTTYDNMTATNPAAITLDGTYKYNGFSHFYDNLLSITFMGGNHFEGRTISNVFSGEYVISGNDVLITHIRCSQFGEKATEANVLHSFVVGGFTATATADGIILSNDGKQLEFINIENEEQHPAEYSYYSNNYWTEDENFQNLTITILPNYIGVNTTRDGLVAMLDTGKNNFFEQYGIAIDSSLESKIGYTEYGIWVLLPILGLSSVEANFDFVRNFPTSDFLKFAVVSFAFGKSKYPLTNEVSIKTNSGVTVSDIIDLLDINGVPEDTYEIMSSSDWYGGVYCYLKLKNISTGIEVMPIISILSNWDKTKSAGLECFGSTYVW